MTHLRIVPSTPSTPSRYVRTDKDTVEELRLLLLEPEVDDVQWVLEQVYKMMGLPVPEFVRPDF